MKLFVGIIGLAMALLLTDNLVESADRTAQVRGACFASFVNSFSADDVTIMANGKAIHAVRLAGNTYAFQQARVEELALCAEKVAAKYVWNVIILIGGDGDSGSGQ